MDLSARGVAPEPDHYGPVGAVGVDHAGVEGEGVGAVAEVHQALIAEVASSQTHVGARHRGVLEVVGVGRVREKDQRRGALGVVAVGEVDLVRVGGLDAEDQALDHQGVGEALKDVLALIDVVTGRERQ